MQILPKEDPEMDQERVARLVLRQRMELTAYIQSIVRDIHQAEDVFQEVCVKAIKHFADFTDETHLAKWVRRVARNHSIDLLRRSSNQLLLLDESVLELIEQEWPEQESTETVDKLEALRKCMGKLTPYSRQVLKLRYMEGLAGTEVADTMNRKVDTIYKALARLHMGLRDCVQRQMSKTQEFTS